MEMKGERKSGEEALVGHGVCSVVCIVQCAPRLGVITFAEHHSLNTSVSLLRNNKADLCDHSRAADREMSASLRPKRCRGTFHTLANISHYHNSANSDSVCVCVLHLDLVR